MTGLLKGVVEAIDISIVKAGYYYTPNPFSPESAQVGQALDVALDRWDRRGLDHDTPITDWDGTDIQVQQAGRNRCLL